MADEYIKRSNAEKAIREYADIKHNNGDITTANCVLKAVSVLNEIPAADVVEVVRCRDCKHFTKGMAIGMCKRISDKPINMPYNNYCGFGKRRCDDENS